MSPRLGFKRHFLSYSFHSLKQPIILLLCGLFAKKKHFHSMPRGPTKCVKTSINFSRRVNLFQNYFQNYFSLLFPSTSSSTNWATSTCRKMPSRTWTTFTTIFSHKFSILISPGQCFSTFFYSRHPYLVLKIFGGTPGWFIRYID